MASPHDKLFKATFSDVEHARSVLASALPPAVSALVNWASLELLSGEVVDAELAHVQSDLLFRARIGGGPACIYVLFEHQSTVDSAMPLRLLRYMTRIWERFEREDTGERLPAIVPVVLHHSDTGWTGPTSFGELLDLDESSRRALARFIPDFAFVLDDLARADDSALRSRALTELARLVLVVLARCRGASDVVAELRPWMETMKSALAAPNGVAALAMVARYILEVGETPPEELTAFYAELGPGSEEALVSTADQLREKGRLEGQLEGAARVVLRLLARRFGPLSPETQAKVERASAADLERWAERLLDAATLEDVLR